MTALTKICRHAAYTTGKFRLERPIRKSILKKLQKPLTTIMQEPVMKNIEGVTVTASKASTSLNKEAGLIFNIDKKNY